VTAALLQVHPPPPEHWVIEPSAGDGEIVAALVLDNYAVWAIEMRPCRLALGATEAWVTVGDWLKIDPRTSPDSPWQPDVNRTFSIVGNVPYDPASVMADHVRHCLEVAPAYCALLLPSNFLHSLSCARCNQANPVNGLYALSRRPSCSRNGRNGMRDLCWFVWDKRYLGRQTIRVLDWETTLKTLQLQERLAELRQLVRDERNASANVRQCAD
jgi:hypothetical protein